MDHIPCPHNAVGTPFKFPYLAVEDYDRDSFLTYPSRKGVETLDFVSLAAFLQTWLFFGLLHEFLEDDYTNDRDWTSISDDQSIAICTRNLPAATSSHWNTREEKDERARHLRACFDRAFQVVSSACELNGAVAETLMSVAILVNFLSGVIRPLSGPPKDVPPDYWNGYSWPSQMVDPFKMKLRSHGWCPSEVAPILENLDMSIASIQLEPPNPNFRHDECGDRYCKSFSAYSDMATYPEPGHIVNGCDCAWFELDVNKAHNILLGGNLPVILVANDGNMWNPRLGLYDRAKLNVLIQSSNEVPNYIAFSHVWSDGLGNPHSNRLRVCKLAMLQRLASEIAHQKVFSKMRALNFLPNRAERLFVLDNEPPTPFWIDTICCPTRPHKAKALGIKMLQQTYKNASSVLVLDSYLQRGVFSKTSDQEILLRLECSRWMHRLWTLQEGLLARELILQFSDGPVGYFGVFRRFRDLVDQGDVVARNLFTNFVLTNKVFSKDLFHREISTRAASSVLYRTLQYRSTTVKSDEAICIANTMGLDIEKVLQAGTDSHLAMSVIWKLLPHIDSCIIFSTTPKINIPGFGWAPETFLDPDGYPETHSQAGTLTEDGLEVRFPGFLVDIEKPYSGKLVYKDSENKRYAYRSYTKAPNWFQVPEKFAIIACRPLESEGEVKATQRCVLARIVSQDERLVAVKIIDYGRGWELRSQAMSDEDCPLATSMNDQVWCVM